MRTYAGFLGSRPGFSWSTGQISAVPRHALQVRKANSKVVMMGKQLVAREGGAESQTASGRGTHVEAPVYTGRVPNGCSAGCPRDFEGSHH